jgi:YjbE family integral membrane protein
LEILSVQFLMALGSIVILDLVLAGDNAVVIAMASRNLPEAIRKKAIYIGTAGAIIIRLLMTLLAVWILTVPFLQAIGGLVLIPIAIKLLKPDKKEEEIETKDNFWAAIKTIIIADAAMGIDNVLAIAGVAAGDFLLVILGILISVPIVVWGSQIIGVWMQKQPLLIYIGAGILAWTAGAMILHDKIVGGYLNVVLGGNGYLIPSVVTVAVLARGYFLARAKK